MCFHLCQKSVDFVSLFLVSLICSSDLYSYHITNTFCHQQWLRDSLASDPHQCLEFRHSNRCVLFSHCCSIFISDIWCWEPLHMLICHKCILFGEIFGKNFGHFLIGSFIFLLSVYFGTNHLSGMSKIYHLYWKSDDHIHEYFWALCSVPLCLLVSFWVLYSIL